MALVGLGFTLLGPAWLRRDWVSHFRVPGGLGYTLLVLVAIGFHTFGVRPRQASIRFHTFGSSGDWVSHFWDRLGFGAIGFHTFGSLVV